MATKKRKTAQEVNEARHRAASQQAANANRKSTDTNRNSGRAPVQAAKPKRQTVYYRSKDDAKPVTRKPGTPVQKPKPQAKAPAKPRTPVTMPKNPTPTQVNETRHRMAADRSASRTQRQTAEILAVREGERKGKRYPRINNTSISPMERLRADTILKNAGLEREAPRPTRPKTTEELRNSIGNQLHRMGQNYAASQLPVSPYDRGKLGQDLPYVQRAKQRFYSAKQAGDREGMAKAHEEAEGWRRRHGYSGGAAGDEYVTAKLSQDDYNRLNRRGQERLTDAKLRYSQAATDADRQRIAEEGQRIRSNPLYQAALMASADANGRQMRGMDMTPAQRAQDAHRAAAGVASVGQSIAGSLGYLGQQIQRVNRDQMDAAQMAAWIRDADNYNQAKSDLEYIQEYRQRNGRDPDGMSLYAAQVAYNNAVQAREQLDRIQNDPRSLYFDPTAAERLGISTDQGETWSERMLRQAAENQEAATEGLNGFDRFMTNSLLGVAQSAPAMALTAIPVVGPELTLGVLGAQAAGQRAYELGQEGVDSETALLRGLVSGSIEAAFERIPVANWTRLLEGKAGRNALKEILKQTGEEATEEAASYVVNYVADLAARDPNASFSWAELAENAGMGAVGGAAFGGVGSMIGSMRGNTQTEAERTENPAWLLEQAAQTRAAAEQAEGPARQTMAILADLQERTGNGEIPYPMYAQMARGIMAQQETQAAAPAAEPAQIQEPVQRVEPVRQETAPVVQTAEPVRTPAVTQTARKAEEISKTGEIEQPGATTEQIDIKNEQNRIVNEQTKAEQRQLELMERYREIRGRMESAQTEEEVAALMGEYQDWQQEWNAAQRETQTVPAAERAEPAQTPTVENRTERRAAQNERRTAVLARESRDMGQAGQEAILAAYDGREALGEYHGAFTDVYLQSLGGTAATEIQKPAALSVPQFTAAAEAGIRDRAAGLAAENRRAARAAGRNARAGVDWKDNYVRKNLDRQTAKTIDRVAKALGVQVIFADEGTVLTGTGQRANAEITGNTVRIEKNNKNPVRALIGHELTHRMQDLSPETYRAFRDYVMSRPGATRAMRETQRLYDAGTGKDFGMEAAMDELAADYAGELFESSEALQKFIQDNYGNRTLLERVLDFFRELHARLTGQEKQQAGEAVRLLEEALKGAEKQVKEIRKGETKRQNNTAREGGKLEAAEAFAVEQATNEAEAEEYGRFSLVTDKKTLDFLDNQEHVTVYRAMQVIDGKLYPPMAAKAKSDGGKKTLVEAQKIGAWYQSDEKPELIPKKKTVKDKKTGETREQGFFILDKGDGSTPLTVAYNPYFHTSASPLNDQFSSAWKRPNLVTVECEIPVSELSSGYRAEFAKDSVGETKWHAGPVASKLKGAKARRVFLSRWAKVKRIVPDAEAARIIANTLKGEDVAVPTNVVTPSLLAELRKHGVKIEEVEGKGGARFSISAQEDEKAPRAVRFSMGGVNARTANVKRLSDAQEMERDGKDAEEIRRTTGWLKGPDGKWRFEISDEDASFDFDGNARGKVDYAEAETAWPVLYDRFQSEEHPDRVWEAQANISVIISGTDDQLTKWMKIDRLLREIKSQGYDVALLKELAEAQLDKNTNPYLADELEEFTLGDYLYHPDLFKAYPELRDMTFRFADLGKGVNGQFDPTEDEIVLNKNLTTEDEVLDTLSHEIQHAVQNIEGFASGASPEYWEKKKKTRAPIRTKGERDKLFRLRRKLNQEKRANWDMVHSVEDLMLSAPTIPRGEINWDTLEQITEDPPEWQRFDQQRDELEKQYGDRIFVVMDLLSEIEKLEKGTDRSPNELYWMTAGEVEAREVSSRREMTDEERRKNPPKLGGDDVVFANGARFSITSKTESPEFKQWFGDWQNDPAHASKVVNEDGTPKVVYHQTGEDFTIFDPRHKGAGTSDNGTPFGIFLKSSDSNIGLRGGKQMALYANIRNPLAATNREDLARQARKMSPEYSELLDQLNALDAEYHAKHEAAKQALSDFMSEWRKENPNAGRRALWDVPQFTELFDAEDVVVEEWGGKASELSQQAKETLTRALRENGYDGVILREDSGSFGRRTDAFIALDAEQVKSATDNAGTFDRGNPDIRYSIGTATFDDLPADRSWRFRRDANDAMARNNTAMFADDFDAVSSGYGSYGYSVAHGDLTPFDDIRGDVVAAIRSAYDNGTLPDVLASAIDDEGKTPEELADELDPDDIVMSAHVWDDEDLAQFFWDNVLEARDIRGIKTQDGAIVFDQALISREPNLDADRRWSYGSSRARLLRENEILREKVNYWRSQVKGPERKEVEPKAVRKLAREIKGEMLATMSQRDIADRLEEIYNGLRNDWSYDQAFGEARKLALEIVEGSEEIDDTAYREYEALRRFFRTTPLVLSQSDRDGITDYNDWRKRNMGRMLIKHGDKSNVDEIFNYAAQIWPEWFDDEKTPNPEAQLEVIEDVLGSVQMRRSNPFEHLLDEAVDGLATHILEENFSLPSMQDYRDAELERMGRRYQERQKKAIERAKENMERRMEEQRKRAAGNVKRISEQQQKKELRGQIVREAGRLTAKLLRGSDKNHIPKELRETVAAALANINLSSTYAFVYGKDAKYHWEKLNDAGPGAEPTRRTKAFEEIRKAFDQIKDEGDLNLDPMLFGSTEEETRGLFDQMTDLRDIPIGDLSLEQLRTVWRTIRAVSRAVTTYGKTMASEKYQYREDWANEIEEEAKTRRDMRAIMPKKLILDLETPYTYFSQLGEPGLAVYRMLRDAQDMEQRRVEEITEKAQKIADEKTVKKWKSERHTFEITWLEATEEGMEPRSVDLVLTTDQIMDLWLLSRRQQARDHLLEGGIVQPEIREGGRTIHRGTDAIRISEEMLHQITATLNQEQREVAKKLQALDTGILAGWGNEASMRAYGYEKFMDRDYWTIHTAKEANFSSVEKNAKNPRSVRNFGLAKNTVPHANNPLDLLGAFDNFGRHAMQMITYASWLNPMEDANRIYNWKFKDAQGNQTGRTIKSILNRVIGRGADDYWQNLMTDIQNGIRGDSDTATMRLINKAIGNAKGAAVGANLRVVIQQPTAFMRVYAVMNPLDVAAGLAGNPIKGWREARQWAGIAARKAGGSFDLSAPGMNQQIFFGQQTALDRIREASGALAGAADGVTWGAIWNAAKAQTARENPGMRKDSREFLERTAEIFTDVIDQTQVVDGVMQRSQAMRSGSEILKQATAFKGEPIMSLNLLLRTWSNWRYQTDPAKRNAARKAMGTAAAALVANAVVNALAQSVWDGIRDDDDDRRWLEGALSAFIGADFRDAKMLGQAIVDGIRTEDGDTSLLQRIAQNYREYTQDEDAKIGKTLGGILLTGNLAGNLNMTGGIPFVSDLYSMLQGYDVTRADADVISDVVKRMTYFIQSLEGEGKNTTWYAALQVAAQAGKLFGIPAHTIIRDVTAGLRTAAKKFDNVPLLYAVEKAIYSNTSSKNKKLFEGIAWQALKQGDLATFEHIRADLMEGGITDGKKMDAAMKKLAEANPEVELSQEIRDLLGIRTTYGEPEPEEEDSFGADDLSEEQYADYAKKRAESYRPLEDAVTEMEAFRRLTDEEKDKTLKDLWTYADQTALEDASGGQYVVKNTTAQAMAEATDHEMTPAEYAILRGATNGIQSAKTADGETISGSASVLKRLAMEETGVELTDNAREWMYDKLEISSTVGAYTRQELDQAAAEIRQQEQGESKFAKYGEENREAVKAVYEFKNNAKADVGPDGKTIRGSAKKKVEAEIDKIPNLTREQKREIYLDMGYAASTCPW